MDFITIETASELLGATVDCYKRIGHAYPLRVGKWKSGRYYIEDRNGVAMPISDNDMIRYDFFTNGGMEGMKMPEYIDKQKLIDILETRADMAIPDYKPVLLNIAKLVQLLPAAEVEPVRHGEWTKSEDDWSRLTIITCSECHEEWYFETEEDVSLLNYRYCPNCGARNDGGVDDEM